MMVVLTLLFYLLLAFMVVYVVKMSMETKVCVNMQKKIYINWGYLFIFFVLLFFAVFRYVHDKYGGTDAYSYVKEFQEFNVPLSYYLNVDRFICVWNYGETLFKLFTLVMRKITSDYHPYFLVIYSLIISGVLTFIYKFYHKKSYFFTLILLIPCYIHSYNVMRGWMSIAICMFALVAINNKKWLKSLIVIYIAILIHTLAVVFLAVWFVCWFRYKHPKFFTRNKLVFLVLITNLCAWGGQKIVYNIVMQTKYSFYQEYFNMEVSAWGYLPSFFVGVLAVIFFPKLKELGEKAELCAILCAMNLAFFYIIVFLPGGRFHDYFALIRMYILSELYCVVLGSFKKGISKRIVSVMLNLLIVIIFIQGMWGLYESADVFPYILSI